MSTTTAVTRDQAEQALHAAALLTEALDQQGPGAGGTALREQLAATMGVTPEEYVRMANLGVEIGQALRTAVRRAEMSRPNFDTEWLFVTTTQDMTPPRSHQPWPLRRLTRS